MRKSDEQSKPSGRQSRKRSGKPFILTLQMPSHFLHCKGVTEM